MRFHNTINNYATQFTSQPYDLLRLTALLTIEDMTYILGDRGDALCIALICFKILDTKISASKQFYDLFDVFALDYTILDSIGGYYLDPSFITKIFTKYKDNFLLLSSVLDYLLCLQTMTSSNIDITYYLPLSFVKEFAKRKSTLKCL